MEYPKTKVEAISKQLERMRKDLFEQLKQNNICLNDDYSGEENEAKHMALGYLNALDEIEEYISYLPNFTHLK